MNGDRGRIVLEREEGFHLEGHIVFMIVAIVYFLTFPLMLLCTDVVSGYLYSGMLVFLFAAIWVAISKLSSYNPKANKIKSKNTIGGKDKFIEECQSFINYYLGTNKGKSFTANSLLKKINEIVQNPELKEYLAENFKHIMEQMLIKNTVGSYEKNGETYYNL
ncbi:MAG: hypothetical protein ACFFA4_06470 [Promethearchaeota archaeon]